MEDYTYDLNPAGEKVLGAHMLEICPSIAKGRPSLEIHPLGIGGKADPVRLVFDTPAGPGLNASMIDLGGRFRLLGQRGGCGGAAEGAGEIAGGARGVEMPGRIFRRR